MRTIKRCVVALAAMSLGACTLDLQNPNSPTAGQVTTSPDGVIALATGLQSRFATSYFNYAYMAGLVTDEFAATSAALISISDAEQGSVAPGTGIADNVFNSIYRTVRTADELLAGADRLAGSFDAGTRSGLKALAYTMKAEALGEAFQSYQKAPVNTFNITTPTYVGRAEALPVIRALLDSAAAQLAGTPASAFFTASILTPGVNLPNMIQVYRARYARMANDDAAALAAANLVPRSGASAISAFTYPAPGANPWSVVTGGTNGIAVRRQYRSSMQAADQRFAFFTIPSTTLTGRVGALLDPFSTRYAIAAATQLVYFPDEALLIKAEALANQGNLAGAQAALDSVRTDCTGGRGLDDPKACLSALSDPLSAADLLTEIYVQRRYELLGTGLRWEDTRRRSAIRGPAAAPAVPVDGQRCWLPYAIGDRNANPNVPADPVEPSAFPATCPL
ncbi:MAG: RagB/SusD family nutrient uptake outer membrane protein [Gemmatimonadaceae bacterium]|nr:RagB/SusD family nutrient uptake outer membrane protein [Gemmatimonadaceae bacterium]